MGVVCSCFASTFIVIGEIFSTAFLAVGEIGAILVRGLFSLIVGLCDVLAACACCCQVPFSQRPDRNGYTYSTLALREGTPQERITDKPKFSQKSFAKVSKQKLFALPSGLKKSSNGNKPNVAGIESENPQESQAKTSTETVETEKEGTVETPAAVQSSWFGGWFGAAATKA